MTVKEEKTILKEQRQLKKLTEKSALKEGKFYFAVILFLIAFVNIIDEIASGLPGNLQSSIVTDFLVTNGFLGVNRTYEEGLALHSSIGVFTYALGIVTPFYKALADRFGRKPLFAISTFGMAAGMLIAFSASNYIVFLLGYAVMAFFTGHDIQIIYVLEAAPSKSRARIYSVLKALGIMGTVAVPVLRDLIMGNDATKWRFVFLVPALFGLVASALVVIFAKETKVFIKERTEYLSIPYEERKAEKELKKAEAKVNSKNQGVINGVKYIFANRDTRLLIICHIVFDVSIAAVGLYHESMMHLAGLSTEHITDALYMIPFVYAGITFFSGFAADKLGRKNTVLIGSLLCVIGFILFFYGLNNGFSPVIIGLLIGLYQGGFWIGRDYMNIMMTEKVPTEIRASVVGAEGLLISAGMAFGYIGIIVGMSLTTVSTACMVMIVPFVTLAAVLLMFKVKETKGVELSEIERL